jgi:Domain of unknown function (DUF4112)
VVSAQAKKGKTDMAAWQDAIGQKIGSLGGQSPAAVRMRIEALEKLMEGLFVIPGTNQRVGLDVILDLIPLGGSVIATAMGAYLAWEARNLGMPKFALVRMGGNIAIDAFLGLFSIIPVIGAIPDLFFRSNTRNVKIIKKYLDTHHPRTATIQR